MSMNKVFIISYFYTNLLIKSLNKQTIDYLKRTKFQLKKSWHSNWGETRLKLAIALKID